MVICKYKKTGPQIYIPHLDLLRGIGMAFRRTELDLKFSEGFNPHAKLYFNQPLPIGTESISEYFCADSSECAVKVKQKLNTSLPFGIEILKSANIPFNPNFAGIMFKADYEADLTNELDKNVDFSSVLKQKEFIISVPSKDGIKTRDVRPMIFDLRNTQNKVYMTLACGNVNLRADRLMDGLLKAFAPLISCLSLTKTAVYDKDGKNFDELFFN